VSSASAVRCDDAVRPSFPPGLAILPSSAIGSVMIILSPNHLSADPNAYAFLT